MADTKLKFYSLVIAIAALLITISFKLDQIFIERHVASTQQQVKHHLSQVNNQLTFNLYKNIQVVKGLPALFVVNPSLSQEEFSTAVQQLFDKHTQLRNIAAAPDLIIKYMYPVAGNEAAIGLDYRLLPNQIKAVLEAKETKRLVLAGPLDLVQGGTGLISRIPVYIKNNNGEESFWGIISAVIDVELLYQRSGLLDAELPIEVAIRGKDGQGNTGKPFFGAPKLFSPANIESTLTLPNGSWQLAARPKGGWQSLPENIWQQRFYIFGSALTLFLLLFAFLRTSMKASIANLKFKDLIESSPLPYVLHNEKQQVTFLNRAFINTYGYTVNDIPTLADWWLKAFPNEKNRTQVKSLWRTYLEQFQSSNELLAPIELEIHCKDGSTRTVLASLTTNENIHTSEYPVVLYDISERKEAEDKLRLSARVFSDTHEGISVTDANGKIIEVNPAFCNITGYSREDVIGQDPSILNSGKQDPEFYKTLWQTLNTTGHWQGEVWNRKKGGEIYAELLTISAIKDKNEQIVNYVGVFSDITQSKQQQEKLNLMAHYDVLTQLPNRALFSDRFYQAIAHSKRSNTQLAICFLDLDNFKPVNDNYGHEVGDQVLIEVAERIAENIREEDTVSRQGGDEFTLLLKDIESYAQCEQTIKRIHHSLAQPYLIDDQPYHITASTGITLYPSDDGDIDTLLRHADQAMYQAKLAGKNRYLRFNTTQNQETAKKHHRLDTIAQALSDNEFSLFYQPKVNMATGDVFGVEALIRWIHPEKGIIPPSEFLPILEGSNLEIQLGNWVIDQALIQLDSWQRQGIKLEVSINISSHHLQSEQFFTQFDNALASYPNVDSHYLQLEILESSALGDISTIRKIIKACKHILGINIALDDFGTGYSSLTHLRNIPVNTIKIDQSFVRDMLDDPSDYAIIDGIIGLSDSFNREVIAEGVETTEHGLMLLLMGCKEAQGYGIAKPMPANEIPSWLDSYTPNYDWLTDGNKYRSEKEKKKKLFRLTTEQWKNLFISNIQSSPKNVEHWPIIDKKHCHCGYWLERAIKDQDFEKDALDKLILVHDEVHFIAHNIQLLYQQGDLELSRDGLEQFNSMFNKMSDALGQCE